MNYLETLFASRLPLTVWALAVTGVAVQAASLWAYARTLRMSRRQPFVVVPEAAQVPLGPRLFVLQAFMAAYFYGFAQFFGGGIAAFLGGGWFIVCGITLATNLRNLANLRRREAEANTEGRLTVSRAYASHERESELWMGALGCVAMLVPVPHWALVGAVFVLTFTAVGVRRQARRAARAARMVNKQKVD
jgi:hypothetical protein